MASTKTLTPEARAFLEAMATEESAGDYSLVYGGLTGTGSITDFSQHPNQEVLITSGPHGIRKPGGSGQNTRARALDPGFPPARE
jgi:muramidase (phage lysozyme)